MDTLDNAHDEPEWDNIPPMSTEELTGLGSDTWNDASIDVHFVPEGNFRQESHNTYRTAITRKHRGRSFQGCLTCRERKIKCDGKRPVCANCEKSRRYRCRGFVAGPTARDGPRLANDDASAVRKRRRVFQLNGNFPSSSISPSIATEVQSPSQAWSILDSFDTNGLFHNMANDDTHALVAQTLGEVQMFNELLISPGASEEDLLDYYSNTTINLMMPTLDPSSNPWLRIYFPLASGSSPSKSQLALRHSIMSVAAHQRAQRTCQDAQTSEMDAIQAAYHEAKASMLIKEVLDNFSSEIDQSTQARSTVLAAALGLISIDIFSAEADDCSLRLNTARDIVHKNGGGVWWKSNELSCMLYQMFCCYETVATTALIQPDTSLVSSPEERELEDRIVLQEMRDDLVFDSQSFILDTAFGIGQRTMSLLSQTVNLAKRCADTSALSGSFPYDSIQDVAAQLYSIEKNPSRFIQPISSQRRFPFTETPTARNASRTAISLPKVVSDEIIANHQRAFHYAVILFFHRAIPESLSARASLLNKMNYPQNLQTLVRKIWDRLENIDCLTRDIQIWRGNTLWPAFIAAVESYEVELRHRALIWFSKASEKGIGNVLRAKEVVMEVWRQVDRQMHGWEEGNPPYGLGPVDWRVAMKEMGLSIMLT